MRNAGVIRLVEPQILIVRGQRVILDPDHGGTVRRDRKTIE